MVPDLIDNAVNSSQVGAMLYLCEDLFFGDVFIDLVEVTGFEQLEQEVRRALRADKEADDLGIVAEVELIVSQAVSGKYFKLGEFLL